MNDRAPDHVHLYSAHGAWSGSTAVGYDAYERDHDVVCAPAQQKITVSSDPAFRGRKERLNPEQLLLAAALSCQLLSFLAVAARARIDVVEYVDDAEAFMSEADRPTRITKITLRPKIRILGHTTVERVEHLVEVAHRECYIANSISSEIHIEPTVIIEGAGHAVGTTNTA